MTHESKAAERLPRECMVRYVPEPLGGIPKVRVKDVTGKTVAEGWYFCYPVSCPFAVSDAVQEVPLVQGVVSYLPGDWGLRNTISIYTASPSDSFELIAPPNRRRGTKRRTKRSATQP